jgi:hypothetical protein
MRNAQLAAAEAEPRLAFVPPLRPAGLKARWLQEDGKTYVELAWNPKYASDSVTAGYKVYSIVSSGPRVNACTVMPLIHGNTCRFEVTDTRETRYKFSVMAVSATDMQSEMSDSVETVIPSSLLPAPDMLACTRERNVITLQWEYPRVEGLKGFRIYQDGTIVANEYEVDRQATRYSTVAEDDLDHKFEIVAVYKSNVKSERVHACEIIASGK